MSVDSVSARLGNSNRDIFWDCAKGLAIICVVLHHLLAIINVKNGLFVVIRYFHMPVFFFVSGHFAYKSIVGESLVALAKKKARRLVVPYFAWTCIAVTPKILGVLKDQGDVSVISRFLYESFFMGTSVWYLLALFITYILVKLLYVWYNKNKKSGAVFCILLIVFFPVKIEVFAFYKIQELIPFFIIGMVLARREISIWKNRQICTKFGVVVVIVACCFLLNSIYSFPQINWSLYILMQIAGDSIGFLFIMIIATILSKKIQRLLAVIGYYSLEVYCMHMAFLKYFFPSFLFQSIVLPVIENLICFAYSILVIVVCILLSKYLFNKIKIYRIILLGKES